MRVGVIIQRTECSTFVWFSRSVK